MIILSKLYIIKESEQFITRTCMRTYPLQSL